MDFYKLLNVSKSASNSDIKKSFRKLALLYHPDTNGGDPSKTEKYKEIFKAYETLSEEASRRHYDQMQGLSRVGNNNYDSSSYRSYTKTSSSNTTTYTWTYTSSSSSSSSSRSRKSSSRFSSDPSSEALHGTNFEEWFAAHYGPRGETIKRRDPFMDIDMENNRHHQYYARQNARAQKLRMEEAIREQLEKEARENDAAENLRQRREDRRESTGRRTSRRKDDNCSIQ